MMGKGCIKVCLAKYNRTPLQCLGQNSYNISCETGSLAIRVGSVGLVRGPQPGSGICHSCS